MTQNDAGVGPSPEHDEHDRLNELDPTGRLSAYMAKSQTWLNVLALLTIWLVVVPPGDFGAASNNVFVLRIALSVIYGVDMTIRARLARRHLRYVVTHPLGVAAVVLPPVRVIFSLRLLRTVFRRGHLVYFLAAASVLVLNGAMVVFLYERHAPGSNIHTFGESLWWSIVTVTTVGYGDFFPVTTPGRIAAVLIMFIGILILAVITANVAASFLSPNGHREDDAVVGDPTLSGILETLSALDRRLGHIEEHLVAGGGTHQQAPDHLKGLGSGQNDVPDGLDSPG